MERLERMTLNKPVRILYCLLLLGCFLLAINCEAKAVEDAKQLIRVKDFQGAAHVLTELAEQGDAEGQYMLAVMYRNGHGVDRDLNQAFNWFLKAAQNKHLKAQYELGMCYKNGLGTQKDLVQAKLWLTRAAQQDYPQAREQLSILAAAPAVQARSVDDFAHAQHAVANNENKLLSQLIGHVSINQADDLGNTLLHGASQHNNVAAAKLLLQHGIDKNRRNRDGNTALAMAIIENNLDMFTLLLDKTRINDRYEAETTAPILAARNGNDDIIRLLSNAGANFNLKDKAGLNAMDYADKRNHASTKALLAAMGVKPTRVITADVATAPIERTEFYKDWTDLMLAAWKGNEQQCRQRLKQDDVNTSDQQGYTALMRAAMKNHGKVLALLLENNADINLQNQQGETALYLAAVAGHDESVTVLLQNKAHVNRAAKNGSTPLIAAVRADHAVVTQKLLAAKADANVQQDNGATALHLALMNKQNAMAGQLLSGGARFDLYDRQGRSPLHLAAMNNKTELLDKMIAAGANINSMDKSGYTLLSYVTEYGSAPSVSSLIKRGADANVASRSGNNTPLMMAADKGLDASVSILVENTADINHKNNHGDTALILAARNGSVIIVKTLLAHGAKVNVRNQNKNTALDVAKLENRSEVVELLDQQQSAGESLWDIIK